MRRSILAALERGVSTRVAAALLGGVVWGSCFRSHPDAILPWVALVPLFFLLERPGLALLFGVSSWTVSIWWLLPTVVVYGGIPWLGAAPLLGLLILYLSLYFWAFAAAGRRFWRRGDGLGLVGLAALWVVLEWLRAYLLGGFPWNLAAYAWVAVPGALPLSSFVGSYGLSFLLVWVSGSLALALRRRRWEPALLGLLVALGLFAVGARFGGGAYREGLFGAVSESRETRSGETRAIEVRLLQPNIQNLVDWDPLAARRNYEHVLRLSRQACDRPGALVVWPESAAWPWAWERDRHLRQDIEALVRLGCGLLFNSPRFEGEQTFNAAYLVGDERPPTVQTYDKHHLVPFGEYVPFGRLLPFVGYLARNAGTFTPGEELTLLDWRAARLGVAICFEVIFPAEVAARVRGGATHLVTITNDAWYGDTAAPWQHLRAVRFRAAENARPFLRAAITGVSASIGPSGELRQVLGVGEEGTLRASVPGGGVRTLYSRAPWLVPLGSLILAVGLISWETRRHTGKQTDSPSRDHRET